MPRRIDRLGRLRSPVKTAEGFLKCDGLATRTGVFRYRRHDGSIVRELRPPAEVHDTASIETLGGKPVTLDHPPEFVTPATVAEHSVGTIGNNITLGAGGYVQIQLDVLRDDAIKAIEAGKNELSCGYTCDVDETGGWWSDSQQVVHPQTLSASTTPGKGWQRFDAIQRNIRYNHGAIVDKGRAGPDYRIKTDTDRLDAVQIHDSEPSSVEPQQQGAPMAKIKVDGVELEVSEAVAVAINTSLARRDAEQVAAGTALTEMTAQRDAEKKRADDLDATKSDEVEVAKRVQDRIALVNDAKSIAPDVKCDGLTDRQVREATLEAVGVKLEGKRSDADDGDAYVKAYFDARVGFAGKKRVDGLKNDVNSARTPEEPKKARKKSGVQAHLDSYDLKRAAKK